MDARTAVLRRLTEQVVAASHARSPLQIRGGGTKAFYGGVPRGDVLEMGELRGITSYEPTELVITALAGTPLAEVEAELSRCGQCLPFEPPRFAPGGTVGGMVAAGLAGPARPSVGGLRDHLLGVSVLNGAGDLLTFGGQVMKNVAGYDVSRVMAGSMGILGVLCEVSLKVMPVSAAAATLRFEMDEAGALAQANHWAAQPLPLSATSWYRGSLHLRLAGAAAAVASVRRRLAGAELEPQAARHWWQDLRDQRHEFFALGAAVEHGEALWRVSVPDTAPPLALPGEQFIEWGGALRWLRSAAPAAQIRDAAAASGGHATLFRAADKSAGVFTAPTSPLLNIHRRLKQSFDPAGVFNPGRLYPEL
jgi:glycolate oxidase FAD binding subunit